MRSKFLTDVLNVKENEPKKLKESHGRIGRAFGLPAGVHNKIKHAARAMGLPAGNLYDQVIGDFVERYLTSNTRPAYMCHQKDTKKTRVTLDDELVYRIKMLAGRDYVAENRVMFTAVMLFYEKNL